jgi:hypothetical protein
VTNSSIYGDPSSACIPLFQRKAEAPPSELREHVTRLGRGASRGVRMRVLDPFMITLSLILTLGTGSPA